MTREHFRLAPSGAMPNHPRFPVLVYRGVVSGEGDAAAALEALFGRNGWPAQWRDGIFDFDHYHTRGHEALGIASGSARVLLGGPGGREVEIARRRRGGAAGRDRASAACGERGFLVVGAYPPGQHADICREPPSAEMLARIAALPAPATDPVGAEDGVTVLWSER